MIKKKRRARRNQRKLGGQEDLEKLGDIYVIENQEELENLEDPEKLVVLL